MSRGKGTKMKRIEPCICPKCKTEITNYWENSYEQDADGDWVWFDYHVHCLCGTKFIYTESYQLAESGVTEILSEI